MADFNMNTPSDVVSRNLRLTSEVMRYLLNNPLIFNQLPDQFELVMLPTEDPAMRLYNLELLDKYGSENRPIVFARLSSCSESVTLPTPPKLFVPVALAA